MPMTMAGQPTSAPPTDSRRLVQNDEFSSPAAGALRLRSAGEGTSQPAPAVRVVNVKGLGSSSEEAQRDAARQAVQQVAGLYIDARRRVESKITDQKVAEVVEEKILSYTNAYLSKLEILKAARQSDGLVVVEARATVIVAPLVKALQASNIPTVAFDTATAIGQVEVSTREKQSAIDLYADLVKRSSNLIDLTVGTPKVDTSMQAPVDKSWLRIPLTYVANAQAIRDWRSKMELIASRRMTVQMPIGRQAINEPYNAPDPRPEPACVVPVFDYHRGLGPTAIQEEFLGTKIPSDQLAESVCFAQGRGSSIVSADCFGRAFLRSVRPSPDICQGDACLSLASTTKKYGIMMEFLEASGGVIESLPINFASFPRLNVEGSSSAPAPGRAAFVNFCIPNQDPFYFFTDNFYSYGDLLIVPAPGSHIREYVNVLAPNDLIARTTNIRAHIVTNLGGNR